MPAHFTHDVFLSHSSKDKEVVRPLAERLRADGLRVWYDDWEIRPGDNIHATIEEGLENSRVLVLCMSASAFGSDWASLESGVFRFRDPQNKERRFLPLKLDDAPARGSLRVFLHVDWRADAREREYPKLLEACRGGQKAEPTPEQQAARERFEQKVLSLGHTGAIRSVAFSPDGRRALSGFLDNTVRLWDVDTGVCQRVLEGHTGGVLSVAFSPDGQRALSGSDDSTVRLWDLETGICQTVLEGHAARVFSVAFSPDGGRALSGSEDNTVRLWAVETGVCQRVLEGHTSSVLSVAFSPEGRRALSGSSDQKVRLWEVETGIWQGVLEGHTDSVRSVAFSPDGRRALSGSYDQTVRLWEVETGVCQRVLEGHAARVWSVAFSPDGRRALSGSLDQTVRLWEVETGICQRVLEGHTASVWSVAFSPDGRRALTGSDDQTVRLWEVETGVCQRVFEGHTARVWNVAFSPDGRRALSGSLDRQVRLWEVETGVCQRVLVGHTAGVWSVAFSPDGRRALTGSDDQTVRLWDLKTGVCLSVMTGHLASVRSVSLSPDGQRALSGSEEQMVRLWAVEKGVCEKVLKGHTASVRSVAFSPDGRRALSGSEDKTVQLWEVETGVRQRVLEGHTAGVRSVAFSPDGRRVLSASEDKTVRLWEVESGACVRVLEGHTSGTTCVTFSPDGRQALSGDSQGTLRLWDLESGDRVRTLSAHSNVTTVAWSRGGRHAFSAALNGVVRVWDTSAAITSVPSEETAQLQYTNAKVLLVGDSGAGKTGLTERLSKKTFTPSYSTSGAWSTQWPMLDLPQEAGWEREIWLWDFGGQADQRLIHQLYLDKTALILLVFNSDRDAVLPGLREWQQALKRSVAPSTQTYLVAGRIDAGSKFDRDRVNRFATENGYQFFETSAQIGIGCEPLRKAIQTGIPWKTLERRTSPVIFKRLKDEILLLRDEGHALMTFKELREVLRNRLPTELRFQDSDLETVIGLLDGPGVVKELNFGTYVLLRPEWINAYAQAVIRTLRSAPTSLGCLPVQSIAKGELIFQSAQPDGQVVEEKRLKPHEEAIVLQAMEQALLDQNLCLRQEGQLVFPSYCGLEQPSGPIPLKYFISYTFTGFLDDVYATLVVKLAYCGAFQMKELWRDAADFETLAERKKMGVKLLRQDDGRGELLVHFEKGVAPQEQVIFASYIHDHLKARAFDVTRLRFYVCPNCDEPVENRKTAMQRLEDHGEKAKIMCVGCEKHIALWDDLERRFASESVQKRVAQLREHENQELDSRRKGKLLALEVAARITSADQKCFEIPGVEDEGLDMEVEFTDAYGHGTGKRYYLQLKSGNSHLSVRKSDGAEIFRIKEQRWVEYWLKQECPVLLVIGTFPEDDERRGGTRERFAAVRWMEISDILRQESKGGTQPVKQIVFNGQELNVASVLGWRDKAMATRPPLP